MSKTLGMRWLVVAAGAALLLVLAAACGTDTKTIEVPGETVVVKEEVIKEVMVPGETVTVTKEVVKEVMVPGETVIKEVVKEVAVPGETMVVEVEKEVVRTVEVPGQTVVVEKEVIKTVAVPGETVVVEVESERYTRNVRGEVVEKPQYGGRLVASDTGARGIQSDPYSECLPVCDLVLEALGAPDYGISPTDYGFNTEFYPMSVMQGNLAVSWEQPDLLTTIFHIRPGVYWHNKAPMNGRELTAHDVEFTWHRQLGLGSGFTEVCEGCQISALPILSVTATDDWTVEVKTSEASFVTLRDLLVGWGSKIQPPEVIEQYGDMLDWKNLVGTGPFELTDAIEGSYTTFTKNPNYWRFDENHPDNRLPYLDEITILLMPDFSTRLAALRTGKTAILRETSFPFDLLESVQRTNPEIKQVPSQGSYTIAITLQIAAEPKLADLRVRQALQKAIDVHKISRTYYKGFADPTPYSFAGPGAKGFYIPFNEWPEETKEGYSYDPKAAEVLLEAAGYPRGADGVRFKLNYDVSPGWGMDVDLPQILKAYWAEIGIDVTINVVEAGLMFERYQTATTGGLTYGELGVSLNYPVSEAARKLTSTGRWGAIHGTHDPTGDALMAKAMSATTMADFMQWSKDSNQHFAEQQYSTWLPATSRYTLHQPWLKGFYGQEAGQDKTSTFIRFWIDQQQQEAMGH